MPYKNPEDRRAAEKRRYEKLKNDPEYKARKKKNAAERYKNRPADYLSWKQRILKEHKSVPCAACGETHPWQCMDFHHKNPAEKEFTVSSINGTREQLESEISKCYVLCCMCHRKLHANLLDIL
jgi:NAD-dependent dihydropyrimidine dehydrogenase PreA subunit